MSRSSFAIALFTLTLAACADDPTSLPDVTARRASVVGADSRARWVFEDTYQSGVDELGNPVYSTAGIRSDGLGAYEGGVCGVVGRIFWYDQSASRSGDAVLDPDGERASGCVARKLHFYLNGVKTVLGPHTNARELMQLAVGESRVQQMGFMVMLNRSCERLAFRLEDGSGVKVERTDSNIDPLAPRTWSVASTGNHVAMCLKSSKGTLVPTGITYVLPFSAIIAEVQ